MSASVWVKATILWLVILVLAILNGTLREKLLLPAVGSVTGQFLSGTFLSICIMIVAYLALPWYGSLTTRQYLVLGLFWLVLTVVFEFSFGRFVLHNTWTELLGAYTFRGGNIWPIVLAVTFIAPWLAARMRGFI